jgi:sugar phosphate permease
MIGEVIFYIVILATAFPLGYLLASLCSDELKKDRPYFMLISCILLIVSAVFLVLSMPTSLILSPIYMVFVLAVLVFKSRIKPKKR